MFVMTCVLHSGTFPERRPLGYSFHPEDTSDKPDLAVLETAACVLGLLCQIVDKHRQTQLSRSSRRGVCSSPAQMSITCILQKFSDKSTFAEKQSHLFSRNKEVVGRVSGPRKGKV